MISAFGFITDFLKLGIFGILSYAGIAAAILVFFGLRQVPLPRGVREGLAVLCLLVSAYSFGHVDGLDIEGRKARALAAQIELMNRKATADAQIIATANQRAAERLMRNVELEEQISDYQEALANGDTTACPADPHYTRRMRRILDSIQSAIPASRSDNASAGTAPDRRQGPRRDPPGGGTR